MRIASLWRNVRQDGSEYVSGKLDTAAGISIPSGALVNISLVKNPQKGMVGAPANLPDYFVDLYIPKASAASGAAPAPAAGAVPAPDDSVVF